MLPQLDTYACMKIRQRWSVVQIEDGWLCVGTQPSICYTRRDRINSQQASPRSESPAAGDTSGSIIGCSPSAAPLTPCQACPGSSLGCIPAALLLLTIPVLASNSGPLHKAAMQALLRSCPPPQPAPTGEAMPMATTPEPPQAPDAADTAGRNHGPCVIGAAAAADMQSIGIRQLW